MRLTPAVCYYRASTAKQETSIPQQRDWAHAEAAWRGLNIAAEFQPARRRRCGRR